MPLRPVRTGDPAKAPGSDKVPDRTGCNAGMRSFGLPITAEAIPAADIGAWLPLIIACEFPPTRPGAGRANSVLSSRARFSPDLTRRSQLDIPACETGPCGPVPFAVAARQRRRRRRVAARFFGQGKALPPPVCPHSFPLRGLSLRPPHRSVLSLSAPRQDNLKRNGSNFSVNIITKLNI